jgi:hypothetical protein
MIFLRQIKTRQSNEEEQDGWMLRNDVFVAFE